MNKMSKVAEHPTAETIKWMRLFLSLEKKKASLGRTSKSIADKSEQRASTGAKQYESKHSFS